MAGENPYSILGVSRDASASEIKMAFRRIVFDHHPDRNKDEESYHIYIRASDAYEILSDPQKKLRYDRDGQLKEDNAYSKASKKEVSPLITQQLFPVLAKDGSEWIIFISQRFDCPTCSSQEQIWESISDEIGSYVKTGKIDISQAPDLAESFGVKDVPRYVSAKYVNGTLKSQILSKHFRTKEHGVDTIFKHWKSSVLKISSVDHLKSWLYNNPSKTHIIQVSSSGISTDFRYVASILRENCIYASVDMNEETKVELSIRKDPSILIYRGHKTQPIYIHSEGRRLLDDIEEFSYPVFPIVSFSNFFSICDIWCVAIAGEPSSDHIETVYDRPFKTARLSSALAKHLSVDNGEWIVASKNRNMYWKIHSCDNVSVFLSICSKLYRTDNVNNLMGNGIDLKENKMRLQFLFEEFISFFNVDIYNGKFMMKNGSLTIPIPFAIIGLVLLFVFLFIFGITDHTRIK